MSVEKVLESFEPLRRRGEITAWLKIESRPGEFADFPESVDPRLRNAYAAKGIRRLFSHQRQACDLLNQGKHAVIVTPTASGKTLCYNLPILDRMLKDPEARAMYLFPTKALAQDQMAELLELTQALGEDVGIHTYDGDTPADMRRTIRKKGRIILTNPDMLHTGMLPHHPKWIELFQSLRFIVVDEMHTYRGVFGSHVANVFRRLKRILDFYGARVQFVCCSATIANPAELAENLLSEPVELISRNGAPRGSKDLIFYNPPLVNPALGLRKSALSAARRFAESFLRAGVQTLAFASSRVNVEVLLRYLQGALHRHPAEPPKVRGYRGGYLPRTRRAIERQLRERQLLGVVSTNALELGIDIGTLEAVVMAGYPGSVASTWQQIGRSGRRNGHSAAVLVARNLPLDQFIVNHPEYFLDRSPEHGLIHPDNLQILLSHIKCAAFELPFDREERFGKEHLLEILEFLESRGTLCRNGRNFHWSAEGYPANSVSLRNVAEENFVVFNLDDGNRAVAEVDFDSAPELIHEDAIYICEGKQYFVETLDYDGRKAMVREVEVDYFTDAITYSGLRVLQIDDGRSAHGARVEMGEVHLTKKFPGFKKIRFYTSENLGFGKIHLPNHELHTTAYWMTGPEEPLLGQGLTRTDIIRGFLGLSYAMQHVATLILMCDIRDLGRSVGDRSARWFAQSGPDGLGFYSAGDEEIAIDPQGLDSFDPTIFLYDNYPGGVGFAEKLFESHESLLEKTAELIAACPCPEGCPSCVGPLQEVGENTKKIARRILSSLSRSALAPVH